MRGIWLYVAFVSACGFAPRTATGDGGGSAAIDAFVKQDGAVDAPPGTLCFGTLSIDKVCFTTGNVPTATNNYNADVVIDTDDPATCSTTISNTPPGNPCVIAADAITVTSTGHLHVRGSRALILVATGAGGITVNPGGFIDASSYTGQVGASALTAASCPGGVAPVSHGGGFGGSFTARGGFGGKDAGNNDGGRSATALATPVALHGGCPGGAATGNSAALADGGGAVALVATTIQIDGIIAAGGGAGNGTSDNNVGGHGGGAGGMIVLDAKTTLVGGGRIDARGGGGGEGSGGQTGHNGTPGFDPAMPLNLVGESLGGSLGSSGGDGGGGGPRITGVMVVNTGQDGTQGSSAAGGGGGGGAAGVIFVSMASFLTFMPPPS